MCTLPSSSLLDASKQGTRTSLSPPSPPPQSRVGQFFGLAPTLIQRTSTQRRPLVFLLLFKFISLSTTYLHLQTQSSSRKEDKPKSKTTKNKWPNHTILKPAKKRDAPMLRQNFHSIQQQHILLIPTQHESSNQLINLAMGLVVKHDDHI